MNTALYTALLCITLSSAPISFTHAQQAAAPSESQIELIKKNVLSNLQHPSLDVRAGSMQLLIDLKKTWPTYDLDFAILPIMEMLKTDEKDEFRILAALTLFHLDSKLGRFAVEQRAKFDESERVARHCAALIRNWEKKTGYTTDLAAEVSRRM